jgi:microcystin-dependent protein
MQYVQPLGEAADAAYVNANPVSGIDGSIVPAAAIEHPQREIMAVIAASEIEPSSDDLAQLLAAIQLLISRAATGSVVWYAANSAPAGFLKANGALVTRTAYPDLWAFAAASGNLVTDANWTSQSRQGSFSSGDGATTFRLPDLRGEFVRAWDDGRGIDSGRSIGATQNATSIPAIYQDNNSLRAAQHTGATLHADYDSTTTSGQVAWATALTSAAGTGNYYRSFTARPRNVALLACIKY